MKKRIFNIIIYLFIGLLVIFIIIKNVKENSGKDLDSSWTTENEINIENFKVIYLSDRENKKYYLFHYNEYDYYLNYYNPDDTIVLINSEGTKIIDEEIENAILNYKKGVVNYKNEKNENMKILPIKMALNNYDVDISWIEKMSSVEKKYNKLDDMSFEMLNNNNDKIIYDKNDYVVSLKNIDIVKIKLNNKEYNNLESFINDEYSIDLFMEYFDNNFEVVMVYSPGNETINDVSIYKFDKFYVGIESEYKDRKIYYYIYYISPTEYNNLFGH